VRLGELIHAVDVHACGEPGRVIVGGVLDVPGASMFEKMQYLARERDALRLRMLREPRGYPASCCNLILPPTRPEADAGFVIMEQTEYPAMSGSNTICVVTVLLETGMLPAREPVTELTLETPAGLIRVQAQVSGGKVKRVSFENVPAFAVHRGAWLEVPSLGRVRVDVAWGGMFYVLADAAELGIPLEPDHGAQIARAGALLRAAAAEQLPAVHPENPEIRGVSIAQLRGPLRRGAPLGARNAVVVCSGELDWKRPETWTGVLDRSPCGTGTCARMALLHASGELGLEQDFEHEGILGTVFRGRLLRETRVGPYSAVVPTLSGSAWITGFSQYVLDPEDPFPEGFRVGDIWSRAD
jgi:proline racemase